MKKALVVVIALALAIGFAMTGCKDKVVPPEPTPVPTMTPFPTPVGTISLVDDLEDGDNRSNSVDWGGYWYTFDDLASPNNGDSKVWPMSQTAADKYSYPNVDPLPTFVMTAPGAGTALCARVSGTVTTTFQYGFVGMGVDLLGETTPGSGVKLAADLATAGYTHIYFESKRGPKDSTTGTYKIKLVTAANGFTDASNHPVANFNPTSTWQAHKIAFTSFAQESGWGDPVTIPQALAEVIAFQWQTNGQPRPADLQIDNIYLIKE